MNVATYHFIVRSLIVLSALCPMADFAAAADAPWLPKSTPEGTASESRHVYIVKQGMEHNRNMDGNAHGIASFHRYRIDRADKSAMWKISIARFDVKQFHDVDVDGDGQTADDVVACHPFSMERPMSMIAPWYDTSIGTQRWFGGAAIYQANAKTSSFSEDGMNDSEEGDSNQPRRNWTLFHETIEIGSPYRIAYLLLWKKSDFMNDGADHPVSFDDSSELRCWLGRYYMGMDANRWVVRNGEQFYMSEAIFRYTGRHKQKPTETRWAKYDPKAPHDFYFDPAKAEYKDVKFNDVTAVGWYVAKDRLVNGYFGCKWEAFEADAVVTAPKRPSSMIDMVEIDSEKTPKFYMSTCEVPYGLWRRIHRMVRTPAHAGFPGFNFRKNGDMGSMDYTVYADPKHKWTDGQNQPVTDITLYDMIAWCNALSAYESRTSCYYEDAEFTKLFREVVRSPIHIKERPLPTIYVKWDADGFRLPTLGEWMAAHPKAGRGTTIGTHTNAVGSGKPNALGIHDMDGNVMELIWNYGNELAPTNERLLVIPSGPFMRKDLQVASASPYGDDAFNGRFDIGLRLVRREAGFPAPQLLNISKMTFDHWDIRKGTKTAPDPARQLKAPLGKPMLKLADIPGKDYAMGVTEVTFAEWKPVYDWAVANGYEFDQSGEMGSMAYWGFGKDWTSGVRTADEPVTGICRDAAALWTNALSELEGRTPVYYADEEFKTVLRKVVMYRPYMPSRAEREALAKLSVVQRRAFFHNRNVLAPTLHVRRDADGYRLPDMAEWRHAAFAGGKGRYPWGNVGGYKDNAWVASNSEFRTHPVGQKKANAFGLHDMIGNVSELTTGTDRVYTPRAGGSFLDVMDRFSEQIRTTKASGKSGAAIARGLMYPDVGFRVLRQNAGPQASLPDATTFASMHFAPAAGLAPFVITATDAPEFDPLQGAVHRANLMRTGVHKTSGVKELKGVKWVFETGGPVRSSPVVVGGVVYVGSYDKHIYAIDAATGKEKWKHKTRGRVSGSAAVVGQTVYFASEDGRLHALKTSDGTEVWAARTGQKPAGSPAVMGGKVYIGAGARGGSELMIMSSGPLLAFDAATGEKLWTGSSGPQGYAAVATEGKRLYAGFGGSCFAAFSLDRGRHTWKTNSGGQRRQFTSMTVVGDSAFIPQTIGGVVFRMNAKTGAEIWRNAPVEKNLKLAMNQGGEFGHEIFTSLAVTGKLVIGGFDDGNVIAFDFKTGKKAWTFPTEKPIHSSPSVAAGLVYFGGWDGVVYALEVATGKPVWQHKIDARMDSSPWPGDNVLYIGADDGKVYALEGK
jgi:eukaryotic-like serine/threonine-protein kinase